MLRRRRVAGCGRIAPALRRAASLIVAMAALAAPAFADTLTGRATIDVRMALPPGLTFEAVIVDMSRADAAAPVIGRTVIESPGQPPIDFTIDYDPADLRPQGVYALRATIRREGALMFTTDTVTPVLTEGTSDPVEVRLRPVSGASGPQPLPAHGLRLPASFTGVLPCADCEGIRHHLDLWPDQVYHMRRDWLGGDGPMRRDEVGRWYADPARGAIVLYGASEAPQFWEVEGPGTLRQMDLLGNPITSDLPYEITSAGTLDPTELEGTFLLGMMTYFADAATFAECLTGRVYPIAMEGDYLALERAYLEARSEPAAPLRVHVEGGLAQRPAMEGPDRMHLIVDRFIKVEPDETCSEPVSTAALTNTYWRIDSLEGEPLTAVDNRREPHLVLLDADASRFRATVGCNQLIGRYERSDDALSFAAVASTMMACPPPLDAQEQRLSDVLRRTAMVRPEGQGLSLLDGNGTAIADLTAVYLR